MARAGLGNHWQCLFANDIDEKKSATYRLNWGGAELLVKDINRVSANELPGQADLAWASFPCQDLSLAGSYKGIGAANEGEQTRSGTFWAFYDLICRLRKVKRGPRLIVLENVYGALTAHGGRDFEAICGAISGAGYRLGAIIVDAKLFVPQSRPRLFIIAVDRAIPIPDELQAFNHSALWQPQALARTVSALPSQIARNWIWWNLPTPPPLRVSLSDVVEENPTGVEWHSKRETDRLLSLMDDGNREKVDKAMRLGKMVVGTVYKRTRQNEEGNRVQRAEVRFDGIAGCLRTPTGGSSRQTIIIVEGRKVRSRLLSPREAARLMGLPDTYKLPSKYNDAYHIAGDGVVVPVVRYLIDHLVEELLGSQSDQIRETRAAS